MKQFTGFPALPTLSYELNKIYVLHINVQTYIIRQKTAIIKYNQNIDDL